MTFMLTLISTALEQVWHTLWVNWPFLLTSAIISAGMKLYVDQKQVARLLHEHRQGGVVVATAVAVGTPLCSCGTTAVILGMMASLMPWAPIVAFMVASPSTPRPRSPWSARCLRRA